MNAKSRIHGNPPREIAPGIWWLASCSAVSLSGALSHLHNAPYLILGSNRTLLWDTSTPGHWPIIDGALDSLLGGRALDYIVPSHPEVAHCGNVHRLLVKYPTAQLVGDVRDYPFYFPEFTDRLVDLSSGCELDLGGHRFVFTDAVIKDLASSQWGYESSQKVLFVGDGFAYSHRPPVEGDDRPTHLPSECTLMASELGVAPGPDQIIWITKAALYWTRFVQIDVFLDLFRDTLRTHPTNLIAPAHGAVIDDVEGIVWAIWQALRLAYSPEIGIQEAGTSLSERTSSPKIS